MSDGWYEELIVQVTHLYTLANFLENNETTHQPQILTLTNKRVLPYLDANAVLFFLLKDEQKHTSTNTEVNDSPIKGDAADVVEDSGDYNRGYNGDTPSKFIIVNKSPKM